VPLLAGAGGLLAACGSDGPSAGSWDQGSFVSRRRGNRRTGWTVLYPPGHHSAKTRRGLPVLIALHPRGGDHTFPDHGLHLGSVLARTPARASVRHRLGRRW
jgi:hypothetical protein